MDVKAEGRPPVQAGEHRKKIYSRALDRTLHVRDARNQIARVSRRSPNERDEIRTFLESKREMVRSHTRLTPTQKNRALAEIDAEERDVGGSVEGDSGDGEGTEDDPPVPGGVGLGVFYEATYKMNFDTGTAAEFSILCPTRPGGNVDTWLYLTAMNRAALGVEAFVAYHAQDAMRFLVFDWSRPDHWQVDLPLESLTPYFRGLDIGGSTHQSLSVLNLTYLRSGTTWTNEAFLANTVTNELDLIYAHDYTAQEQEQQAGWTGSWGPIIETFQHLYRETAALGFALAAVASRFGTEWEGWQPLVPDDTYVRQDGVGFGMVHLEPNHTFVAAS